MNKAINIIERLVRQGMTNIFQENIMERNFKNQIEGSYFMDRIVKGIWYGIHIQMDVPNGKPENKIEIDSNTKEVSWNGMKIMKLFNNMSSDKGQLEKLFNGVLYNKTIYNEIKNLRNRRDEIQTTLRDFKKELSNLTIDIKHGAILKGKCGGCSYFKRKFDNS